MIPPGAMPMVDNLRFCLLVSDILSGGDLCLRNLPSLKDVSIKLYGEEENSERYFEAKAAVERAVADHSNHPGAFIPITMYPFFLSCVCCRSNLLSPSHG
jgi:hypothetical protein